MKKKLRFLLLDANVVIRLFELSLWPRLVEQCDLLLARTVAECEAQFFEDDQGLRHEIDLAEDIAANRVDLVDVTPGALKAFITRFDPWSEAGVPVHQGVPGAVPETWHAGRNGRHGIERG